MPLWNHQSAGHQRCRYQAKLTGDIKVGIRQGITNLSIPVPQKKSASQMWTRKANVSITPLSSTGDQ